MANLTNIRGQFDLPDSIFEEYRWMADGLLDNIAGVDCRLYYPPNIDECDNCLTSDTVIKTNIGYKNILEIKVGDIVYDGQDWQNVEGIYEKKYSGNIVNIKTYSMCVPLSMTEDHKLFGIKDIQKKYSKYMRNNSNFVLPLDDIEKIKASDLNNNDAIIAPFMNNHDVDLPCVDIPGIGTIIIDDDFLYFLGWWLAEGSVNYKKYIREGSFALCASKENCVAEWLMFFMKDRFNITSKKYYSKDSDGLAVHFYSTSLARFLALFGHGAENKYIPPFLWHALSSTQKMKILVANAKGDGHVRQRNQNYAIVNNITTISKIFAFQLRDILLQNNILNSIYSSPERIDKNGLFHKESYVIEWSFKRNKKKTGILKSDLGHVCFIRNINIEFVNNIFVYDFQVSNSHKYIANGLLSSNCILDPKTKRSSNIYKSGGPLPFSNFGLCGRCHGRGRLTFESTENITLRTYHNPSDFINIGGSDWGVTQGIVMIIGYLDDLPKVENATKILLNSNIEGIRKYFAQRHGEMVPFGLGSPKRYFLGYVERQGGG